MGTTDKMLDGNLPTWLDETNGMSVIVRQHPVPALLLMEFIADIENQGLGIASTIKLDRKTKLFTVTFKYTKAEAKMNEYIYHMCRDYIIQGTRFYTPKQRYDHNAGGADEDWQGGYDR